MQNLSTTFKGTVFELMKNNSPVLTIKTTYSPNSSCTSSYTIGQLMTFIRDDMIKRSQGYIDPVEKVYDNIIIIAPELQDEISKLQSQVLKLQKELEETKNILNTYNHTITKSTNYIDDLMSIFTNK